MMRGDINAPTPQTPLRNVISLPDYFLEMKKAQILVLVMTAKWLNSKTVMLTPVQKNVVEFPKTMQKNEMAIAPIAIIVWSLTMYCFFCMYLSNKKQASLPIDLSMKRKEYSVYEAFILAARQGMTGPILLVRNPTHRKTKEQIAVHTLVLVISVMAIK